MRRRRRTRFRQVLLAHLHQVRGSLLLVALCTVGVTTTELLKPWPLKVILDHGILDHPLPQVLRFLQGVVLGGSVRLLVGVSAGLVAIAACGWLFSYFQVSITSSIGYRMVSALRRELFAHLQRLSLSFHNRARSGDLLTRIAGDSNILKNIFAESIPKFAAHSLTVVGMFAVMFALNWKIGLIALGTLTFLGFSLFHLFRKTKEKHEDAPLDATSADTMRAAATRSSAIITAAGTAAAVLFGALEVMNGQMLPGELVPVVTYMTTMYNPITSLAKLSTDFSKAMASADRLSEILDLEPEFRDRPDAIAAGRLRGEIVFERVSLGYGDGEDVLRKVSFAVSPGQRVALVGVSGAGTSTIASLILRVYEPDKGAILIDGVEIRRYGRESLRRQIGLVLQESILFGATIRENIAFGRPEASLEEIVVAAAAANADEFIRELPDGYDTVLGERGPMLSGGQRQRIAIARAVIRDTPILILDEPMTGLDVESEAKVREALDRLKAGRTCLMIAHDLQSITDADLVLVLENGRIIDRGTHAELVAMSDRYRQLYELSLEQPATSL
jgi:ATP-binding cassette, subfamily B, bacterial